MSSRLYQRLFAFGMCHGFRRYRRLAGPHLRRLLARPSGKILEIGCGTGRNLALLANRVTRWTGIDVNPYMLGYAREAAARRGLPVALARMDAGSLAFADESFDAVIAVLVLCSVPAPERVLAEVRRVLRPGGFFYFFEHVAAEEQSRLRRWQERTAPLWRHVGDGCSPARPTLDTIRAAGFATTTVQNLSLPIPIFSPHLMGWAQKG